MLQHPILVQFQDHFVQRIQAFFILGNGMGQGFLALTLFRFTGFLEALRHVVIVHLGGLGALPDLIQHDFFQHRFRDTVLSTMRFAKSVVGFAAVYRYMVVRIRYPMRQRFPAFAALDQPSE